MNKPLDILKEYWGHNSFRYPQEAIINSVLNDRDTLALLPTGGGKSVCFQIPAILKPGICLVISPLVALIKDQAQVLSKKGIKTIALAGNISYSDLDALLDNAIHGNYKFLYLSPERLKQDLVLDRIMQMPVNLIAVDEAHCISQWGNDFRPAYKEIAMLREPFPHVPVIALTATATDRVRKDILENLQFKNHQIFTKSFARPNLSYQVIKTENKLQLAKNLIEEKPGNSIIYVRNRKETIYIANHLTQQGIPADYYHGGISSEDKQTKLNKWLKNESRVMVATSAFGMGIDKADVRTVFHLAIPENLENYYQEAGRAGRDGKPAFTYLLSAQNDAAQVKKQFLDAIPDVPFTKLVYKKLNSFLQVPYGEGEHTVYLLKFNQFCSAYGLPAAKTYNTLKLLDRHTVLKLSESFHRKTKVQFKIAPGQVLPYLEKNQNLKGVTQAVLRTYGGIFDLETPLNIYALSQKTGVSERQVLQVLEQLAKDNVINYTASHTDAEITFLVPREDDRTINTIAKDIKNHFRLRKQQIADMIAYVNNERTCRSIQLLNYFGEENASPCSICSVCLNNTAQFNEEMIAIVAESILKYLKKGPQPSVNIVKEVTFNENTVIKVLRLLLESGKVKLTNLNQFTITE